MCPSENRGRRESRALAAPAASRAVKGSTRVSHHRFNRNIRPSLRNGVNGLLRALPGVRDLLVTVACRRLSTSQGAPGPHAFAITAANVIRRIDVGRVHRIPPRVRDDAYAPPVEARRRGRKHEFLKNGSKLFFAKGLDRNSQSSLVGQISLAKRLNSWRASPVQCFWPSHVAELGSAINLQWPAACRML